MADVIKTWKTGDVINAEDMNRIEANAANAMSLSKTNETDIAAIESGQTHSMVADTQTPTVPTNLKVTVGLIPVWKPGQTFCSVRPWWTFRRLRRSR